MQDEARRRYLDSKSRLAEADARFEDREEVQDREAFYQREAAGEENSREVRVNDLDHRSLEAGRALTRELDSAEKEYQNAKRECQDVGTDILSDEDLSLVFPVVSQDGLIISGGVQTEEDKEWNAPSMITWCRTLPDLIDTCLADQESFTFVPDRDEFLVDPPSLRDFDSASVEEQGKKRKRIDSVMDENDGLREAAVDHWARTQKRSKSLFHESDGLRVYSRVRR